MITIIIMIIIMMMIIRIIKIIKTAIETITLQPFQQSNEQTFN